MQGQARIIRGRRRKPIALSRGPRVGLWRFGYDGRCTDRKRSRATPIAIQSDPKSCPVRHRSAAGTYFLPSRSRYPDFCADAEAVRCCSHRAAAVQQDKLCVDRVDPTICRIRTSLIGRRITCCCAFACANVWCADSLCLHRR